MEARQRYNGPCPVSQQLPGKWFSVAEGWTERDAWKAILFRHASPRYNDLPLTGHDRNLSWDGAAESRQILVLRFLENLSVSSSG